MDKEILKIFKVKNDIEFNNLDINHVKSVWSNFIMSYKDNILSELQEDINDFALSINDEYESDRNILYYNKIENLKILFFLKKEVLNYNINHDLKKIQTNAEVIKFWPTLFLPGPLFV
tara:strand:+ start:441 stop:794 length:354 start_codon:yes stop_codon:yes gene_type:complete